MKLTKRTTTTTKKTRKIEEEWADGSGEVIRHAEDHYAAHAVGISEEKQATWTHPSVFYIEYPPAAGANEPPSVKVFANGRQQIRIRVIISARNAAEEYVPLDIETLKTITLVNYNTGLPLPSGWSTSFIKNEYTYDSSVISGVGPDASLTEVIFSDHDNRPGPRPRVPDQNEIDIYITTTDISDNAVRIAASIKPNGSSYTYQTRPGASGGGPGSFDSSVNVYGRPPLNPGLADFKVEEVGLNHQVKNFYASNYYFSLEYQNVKHIDLIRLEPQGSEERLNVHVDLGDNGGWEGSFTICQKKYSTNRWDFSRAYVPSYLDNKELSTILVSPPVQNARYGSIVYVHHQFNKNWHFYWDAPFANRAGQVIQQKVYFVDEYGNRHKVVVGFRAQDEFRWLTVVSKW